VIPVDSPVSAVAATLVDLNRDDCLALLAGGLIGRVVVSDGALPAAYPVPYLLDCGEVLFRAATTGRLAVVATGRVVGFQADDLDADTRTGWSVLAVGEVYEVVDPSRFADLADRLPEPWIPDPTARMLALPLQRLTGRRIARQPG